MQIEVGKKEIISLIKGVTGYESYLFAAKLAEEGWGKLDGFPNEKWSWNDKAFNEKTETQLLEFYDRLKKESIK